MLTDLIYFPDTVEERKKLVIRIPRGAIAAVQANTGSVDAAASSDGFDVIESDDHPSQWEWGVIKPTEALGSPATPKTKYSTFLDQDISEDDLEPLTPLKGKRARRAGVNITLAGPVLDEEYDSDNIFLDGKSAHQQAKKARYTADQERTDALFDKVMSVRSKANKKTPAKRGRGRPRKAVVEKAEKSKPAEPVAPPPVMVSVWAEVEGTAKMVRGKTPRGNKLTKGEPFIEGPGAMNDSTKWGEFLRLLAEMVSTKPENLSVPGFRWCFRKLTGAKGGVLPVNSPEAFDVMINNIRALPEKEKVSASIFVLMPQPKAGQKAKV